MNILLVDPCRGSRHCFEETLCELGANVVALDTWSELIPSERPDLNLFHGIVVCGSETTELTRLANESNISVWIAVGPTTSIETKENTLTKPFHSSELAEKLVKQRLAELAPQELTNSQPVSPSTELPATHDGKTILKILVAEDGLVNQCVLVGLLDLAGHESTIANNGREAVDLLKKETFDLCLMDLDMPELDGIAATKEIRMLGIELPIYSMTAHHDQQHADLCFAAGMNGFLTKPIDPMDLQSVLNNVASKLCASITAVAANESLHSA